MDDTYLDARIDTIALDYALNYAIIHNNRFILYYASVPSFVEINAFDDFQKLTIKFIA